MNTAIKLYYHLLADVSIASGGLISELPDDIPMAWVLKEGPALDKALLRYLEHKETCVSLVDRHNCLMGMCPEWLKPLLREFLLNEDPNMLKLLRQVLVFGYKIEFEPTNEQLKEAQALFEETDACCAVWESSFDATQPSPFMRTARKIIHRIIYAIDWEEIVPSHGPGAVFPASDPCDKSRFDTIIDPIDRVYPFREYFQIPAQWPGLVSDANTERLFTKDTIECRLVAVPKDSRGPRLICVHPKEAIWIQQGQRRLIESAISEKLGSWINFRDQSVNGMLALKSSADREYITLDLKEASDRISCELVRYLFGDYAYSYISCARAETVRLLDGRVIRLRKWAPMGNCLTFPIQSLIFYALVRANIECRYGEICDDIFVFGDDIITPSKYYDAAINALVRAGLVPNIDKTFRRGFFRESCGVDAFKGIDVTPHRLKRWKCSSIQDSLSLCTLAKNMRIDGYENVSSAMYSMVRKRFPKLHLSNNKDASGIVEYVARDAVYLLLREYIRFNRDLHRWETRYLQVIPVLQQIDKHDWCHVLDSLVSLSFRRDTTRDRYRAALYAKGWMNSNPLASVEKALYAMNVYYDLSSLPLEYPAPHRSRSTWGWTPISMV